MANNKKECHLCGKINEHSLGETGNYICPDCLSEEILDSVNFPKGDDIIIQHTVNYTLDELKNMVKAKEYASDEYVNVFNGKPIYKILDVTPLPGEVFRKYPPKKIIEVSNLGRIKIDNKIIEQWDDHPNGKGYLYIKIKHIIGYPEFVYRFVAETWCQCPNILDRWEVHHISNNGHDNRPDNLLWIRKKWHGQIPTL